MAFTSHDAAALTAFMTDTVTWSGPVWRLVGRQQVADAHHAFWTDRPDVRWDYRPTDIRVFDAWHWLSERGTWVQAWTAADGPTELRGTYQAFWKQVNGQWRLDAHLFVTTSCKGGGFCKRASYQEVVDKFVTGEAISEAAVRAAWENSTQTQLALTGPRTTEFVRAVRATGTSFTTATTIRRSSRFATASPRTGFRSSLLKSLRAFGSIWRRTA